MTSYNAQIVHQVTSWDGITAQPHRFGGTEFNIGQVEIGHIHGSHMLDVPFTVKIRESLVAAGEAHPHHLLHASGWISFYLRKDADVQQAIKLLRLSYLQKRLRRADPTTRAAYEQEIAALPISAALKNALLARRAERQQDAV
ncbi:MAG: DUF5519 family protein [Chloroflexi bacterium]|nr:DUF5519 family protein [Chloroflexota bacterium]